MPQTVLFKELTWQLLVSISLPTCAATSGKSCPTTLSFICHSKTHPQTARSQASQPKVLQQPEAEQHRLWFITLPSDTFLWRRENSRGFAQFGDITLRNYRGGKKKVFLLLIQFSQKSNPRRNKPSAVTRGQGGCGELLTSMSAALM